jgi:hypothetical protein
MRKIKAWYDANVPTPRAPAASAPPVETAAAIG